MSRTPVVLTIAGSDTIAGAGVQADLKTFAAHGVYGVTALTAITAQNTSAIAEVVAISPLIVRSQIDEIAGDVEIAATKTGMLASADITEVVADAISRLSLTNIVVDPVMSATAPGARTLLTLQGVEIMKARLLPLAAVVTPNVGEAAALSGIDVKSLATAKEAAKRIADLGPKAVVVKGGHLAGPDVIDILFHDGTFTEVTGPRSKAGPIHGTGCTFASAVAAGLALGDDISAAVHRAKAYVNGAIAHAIEVGHGARMPDHFWQLRK